MRLSLVLLAQAVYGAVTPQLGFRQNVFNLNHEVLAENPDIVNQGLELDHTKPHHNKIHDAWVELIHEASIEDLKKSLARAKTNLKHLEKETVNSFGSFTDDSSELMDDTISGAQKLAQKYLETDDFEVLTHENENYDLRVKKNGIESLKLDTVEQYVGYFDVKDADKHFFYWFFESRNDPANDPIILWLNGGPGCASDTGLFFELGPSFINGSLQPVYNPFSWNSNASVIFLDQPVGVGYSYAGKEDVVTSQRAAKDVYMFLELFFQKFPDFLQNKFHVAGESYGGHYIPTIGAEIISHPERSFELSSLIIGNGAVDYNVQYSYDQKMLCSEGGIEGVLSPENCTQMDQYLDQCLTFRFICQLTQSLLPCIPSEYYCNKAYGPLTEKHLNRYDLRLPCEKGGLCYEEMEYIDDYMNLNSVKEAIGVPMDLNFTSCSEDIGDRFFKARDRLVPTQSYLAKVLDYGVPVLHYAGDKDFACHWLGFNGVSNTIKYKNQEEFKASEFKPWYSKSGEEVGQARGYEHFSFLRIYGSGHMVPHDQPEVALEMLNTWLANASL